MTNIFLKNSCTKCGEETNLKSFSKSKLSISQNQQSDVLYSLFLFYVRVENYNNILKLKGAALLLLYSLFLFYVQV